MWSYGTSLAGELNRAATGRFRLEDQPTSWRGSLARLVWWRTFGVRRRRIATTGRTGQRDEALRRVEAVLFLAREPLSSRKLCQYANLADATEARTLVRRLNALYEDIGRAFRVEEVAGGFQLLTRPKFAKWLRRLSHVPRETRLSAPALETLAVVAYRQPIGRAAVEAIRGVNCGEILRQLMERELIRIQSRSDELGRPYLYGTTRRFLQLFGLTSLDHLPRAAQLRGGNGQLTQDMSNQGLFPQEAPTAADRENEEESDVTATFQSELPSVVLFPQPLAECPELADVAPRCSAEDEDFEDDEEEDFEDDEEEDFEDDEEEDFEDDEEEDFEDDEDEDFDDDEDFEDDEWEEVEDDDEDEEWEEDDEDLDDWDSEEDEDEEDDEDD